MENKIKNIAILTIDCVYSNIYLETLLETISDRVSMICISERFGGQHGSVLSQAFKHVTNSGLAYTHYLGMVFLYFKPINTFLNMLSSVLPLKRKYRSIRQLADFYGIPIMKTNNINSESMVNRLRLINPDLILSAYFDQIMKKDIFSIPRYGTVNFHPGILPDYPGPAAAFWAMKNNGAVGSTLHFVDHGVDTGDILHQSIVSLEAGRTVLGVDYDIFASAAKNTTTVLEMLEKDDIKTRKQTSNGYFSYPLKKDIKEAGLKKIRMASLNDYVRFFRDRVTAA